MSQLKKYNLRTKPTTSYKIMELTKEEQKIFNRTTREYSLKNTTVINDVECENTDKEGQLLEEEVYKETNGIMNEDENSIVQEDSDESSNEEEGEVDSLATPQQNNDGQNEETNKNKALGPTQLEQLFSIMQENICGKMNENMNNIQENLNKMDENMGKMENKMENKMDENMERMENKIENLQRSMGNIKFEMREEIHNLQKIFEEEYEKKWKHLENKYNDFGKRIYQKLDQQKEDMNKAQENMRYEVEINLRQTTQDIQTLVEDSITQQTDHVNSIQVDIKEINNKIEGQENKISVIETQLKEKPARIQEIVVTCSGNSHIIKDQDIPKFNGRMQNPNEFLQKFKKYYLRVMDLRANTKFTELEILHECIELALERHANGWWQLNKDEITNWDEFEQIFIERFWNKQTQKGILQKLKMEKYIPGGKLTRTEYFISRVVTLKSMLPTPTEEEIIYVLTEHFSTLIQDAIRVQNIQSIKQLELLLQREDLRDSQNNMTGRPQYTNQNYNGMSYNKPLFSQGHKRPYKNDKMMYQPKFRDSREPWKPQGIEHQNTGRIFTAKSNPWSQEQNTNHPSYRRDTTPKSQMYPYQSNNHPNNKGQYYKGPQNKYPTHEQMQVCNTIIDEDGKNNSITKNLAEEQKITSEN